MAILDDIKSFSIKTFISDVPRMLNRNFEAIKETIKGFYSTNDSGASKLTASKVDVNEIDAQTIRAFQYILVRSTNNEQMSMMDIIDRIEKLEKYDKEIAESILLINAAAEYPLDEKHRTKLTEIVNAYK